MNYLKALNDAKAALAAKKAERLNGAVQAQAPKGGLPEAVTKTFNKFGVKSFEQLVNVNTADKKFAYIPQELREQVKALKEAVDVAVIMSELFQKPVKELKFYNEELSFHLKAFGISSGDEGFEWIPTLVSSNYIEEYNLERKVSGLFMDIPMPSNPYKFPVLSSGAVARMVAPVTTITGQTFDTDKTITFDAKKLMANYELPEELNEDSAVDMIRVIRGELISSQEKALEIAILEGDTAATMHHFTQLPDELPTALISAITNSPERSFVGIRKRLIAATVAVAGVDAGAVQVSEVEMFAARVKLGKYGVNPKDCVIIAGVKGYNQLLQLDDVRTLDTYGPQATVLTGELAKYDGMSIIVSEFVREDTNAVGVNSSTAGDNIKGTIFFVNRKRWFLGTRRAIQIKVEKNRTQYDVVDMVSFTRKAFQAVLKADGSNYASESSAAMIYNIAL